MVTICVDAMGGDEGPEVVLGGIAQALAADSDVSVVVSGPEGVVVPFCDAHDRAVALVASEAIGMGEHPATAVRAKRDSSIVRGCEAVRSGDAAGFFSAGSTGAILAAATMYIGRIRGIKRPALGTAIPGSSGRQTVLLDMGANADVRPDMIVQFAHMGRAYAQVVLGVEDPRVALLSNGSESTKGSEQALGYHQALAAASPWFAGNAEGTDLLAGRYDVIVSDGFTGNVGIKTIEGTATYLMGQIKAAARASKLAAIGAFLLKPAIKAVAAGLSGDAYGGAVLMGLKAPVIIGHGATSALAVCNGTLACANAVRGGLVERLAASVARPEGPTA